MRIVAHGIDSVLTPKIGEVTAQLLLVIRGPKWVALTGRWCMARSEVKFPVAGNRSSHLVAVGHSNTSTVLNDPSTYTNTPLRRSRVRNVASINLDEDIEHPAMFPKDLIEPFVKATTEKDDLVLDVFAGKGIGLDGDPGEDVPSTPSSLISRPICCGVGRFICGCRRGCLGARHHDAPRCKQVIPSLIGGYIALF